ncbi:MAG: hypothetical protein Q9166_005935 [cf. Caloplaca sp. 2 TL-2023]
MVSWEAFRRVILLLSLVPLAKQVDIRIERTFLIAGEAESFIAATCLDILPGVCCKPPSTSPDATTKVLFRSLTRWDIAAVWRDDYDRNDRSPNRRITGCSGPLLASRPGPGSWLWRQPAPDRRAAEGASYISMPRTLPPDRKTSGWLAWEGLLGLEWSGRSGRWFASSAAEDLLGGDGGIAVGARHRRELRSTNRGNVFARPPLKVKYPALIEINGTKYTKNPAYELLYGSSAGEVLNLTDWFLK